MINIRIIFFLLAGTLFFFLLLRLQGKLETIKSPASIVSLELAHDAPSVEEITTSWNQEGMTSRARTNIWIDFLFIPFYVMLFYTLCGSISVRMNGFSAKLGVLLAFGSLMAGVFDVLENILMLFSLHGHYNNFTALLTAIFATAKFSLLLLAVLYILPWGMRLLLLHLIHK
jgi:hypothetical protein